MRIVSLLGLVFLGSLGCGASEPVVTSAPSSGPPKVIWEEHFEAMPADWKSPSGAGADEIAQVFSLGDEGFLQARHDAAAESSPPAIHFGKPWRDDPLPLGESCSLSWRWRVRKHPAKTEDRWQDLAASVYVIMKTPGLLSSGRGFKFGWIDGPAPKGTDQRGLKQIQLRAEPASDTWHEEKVNLCSLYRSHFGNPNEEGLAYIGVVSDGDNSESVVEADYDDFVLKSK